ncbi:ABC transporter substrate-binding protein [Paramaledivibacter caminithermalis]|jgi:iron complex transport system substrate-binding protein|uniref:Iron complex transport system substrate-binding protein n=1 Tax=Paramaledivibacter caminithermalis (strain DSM 15212 / CIP 107654 / DViRD3) TaxID=1121301 RepID=A0A1M6P2Z1_PARC5|nr:ABC transporter substrate-binding protein [Paramaledivibacter caminithermalis]SHK02242.1 iron complex transport system substrate-binding protein [Paramaledivibacter caminithermalis DSM 15212]
MKKKISIFLILILCTVFIGILSGCSDNSIGTQPVQKEEAVKEVQKDEANKTSDKQDIEAKKEIIIDQNGREVILPEKIDNVVMTALPLPSIYALTGEAVDKIVGMHPGAKSAIENSIMGKMTPELVNKETGFIEGTDLNIEEVLKLKPDIAFYWGSYTNQQEQWEKAGIPAIAVKTQGGGDALETLSSWLKILGKVFNKESRVDEVIKYGEKTLADIQSKTDGIPVEEKAKALILFKHSESEIVVPGKGHYGQFWIEATGGYNVAREINVTANVNMEQVYKWNPQIIFISSFTETMPQDLYDNNIEGQDWSKVDAVKNKRVYKIPVGVYRWYPPSGDVPLMMKWMAKHQYPELFEELDMKEETKQYYKTFYNYELRDDDVEGILNPAKAAANGTGGLGKQ